jgi:hypothetical protein
MWTRVILRFRDPFTSSSTVSASWDLVQRPKLSSSNPAQAGWLQPANTNTNIDINTDTDTDTGTKTSFWV